MNKNTPNITKLVKCVQLPCTRIPASGGFILESTIGFMNIAHQLSNIMHGVNIICIRRIKGGIPYQSPCDCSENTPRMFHQSYQQPFKPH